ncbi:MAG: Hpt domain-containing protein [Verrucomicrobiales bacterium]
MQGANDFSSPPVDMDRLRDFTDGTSENLRELINLYIDQTDIYLTELKTAADAGDPNQVRRIAHSAAGSSATCGMTALAAFLRTIEQAAEGSSLDEALLTLPHALAEYDRVKAYLLEHSR